MHHLRALAAWRRHRWVLIGLTLCLVFMLGGSLALVLPGRAHAATITVTTCTESALRSAITAAGAGGTVSFGCSGTITLGAPLDITSDLTLDGHHQNVTLDGHHSVQVLSLAYGVNFTLNHLTIANGLAAGSNGSGSSGGDGQGGGLYSAGGAAVTLSNCTFIGNTATGGSGGGGSTGKNGLGGGLYVAGGSLNLTLTLTNCTFTGNTAQGGAGGAGVTGYAGSNGGNGGSGQGGGLYVAGFSTTATVTLNLTNCIFTGNSATGGPGGNGGVGTGNIGGIGGIGGDGLGGGLYVQGDVLVLTDSTFTNNTAQGGAGGNGGNGVGGYVGGNGGYGAGGGLEVTGHTLIVTDTTVSSNIAQGGAAGKGGNSTLSTLSGGPGGQGGPGQGAGLYILTSGSAILTNSTFADSLAWGGSGGAGGSGGTGPGGAGGAGGFGQGGGLWSESTSGTVTLPNTTISGNTAQGGAGGTGGISNSGAGGNGGLGRNGQGGGLYTSISASTTPTLANSTVAANTTQGGAGGNGGIGGAGKGSPGNAGSGVGNSVENPQFSTLHIANSILSDEGIGTGTNCDNTGGQIVDGGYNLDSGTSCGFSSANHSLSNTDPKLGPLANNGGPTQTMALLPGSPAIDAGGTSANGCPPTDQRDAIRPQGAACDIGAYEFGPAQPPGPPQRPARATITTRPTASPNPGRLDQAIQLCAFVAPAAGMPGLPSGTVRFQEGATTLGTATLNSNGKGCFSTSTLSLGDHHISARYGGDGSFSASASAPLVVSIQVQGQDVAGGAGGGRPLFNPPSQGQATGGQNASGNGAGQTQRPMARHRGSGGLASWLGTGLGLLLLLLGLGVLGGVFYRASRRRLVVGTEPSTG